MPEHYVMDYYSPDIKACRLGMDSPKVWVTMDPIYITPVGNNLPVYFTLTLPSGVKSNAGSIPVLARGLVQTQYPSQLLPFVVHDYLVGEYTGKPQVSWHTATTILDNLLYQMGERGWRRAMIVSAVKLYGFLRRKP